MINISRYLSRKLSLNILLMAAPVFVLSLGVFYFRSQNLIRQEAIERSNSIVETTIQHVNNYLNTIEVSVNANAWLLEEHFTPDSLQAYSRRIVKSNPNILSCSVCAEPNMFPQYGRYFSVYTVNEGDTIFSVRETEYGYADKVWYKEPLRSGKACWVEPFKGHTEGTLDHNEAVATYSCPLRAETGEMIGVVSANFSFSLLTRKILSTEQPYPDAYFVLLGGDGRYFIHPDTTRLFRKTIFTDSDPHEHTDKISLGHQMTGGKQGTMHVDLNGQRCHVTYQPVPGTDWSLAMVCPEKEILAGYHRLAYVIIILIVLGLLAMMWLCYHVVRQTLHPINQLLGYTQLITEGEYDVKIPRSDLDDDIGQLQNSFAAMQEALYENMGNINRTVEEIKKQNEQRARNMQLVEETIRKKSVFIQNLSHQIRTPLNIIDGFAELLQSNIVLRSKGNDSEKQFEKENLGEVTDMMKQNAVYLKRMVLMLYDSSSSTGADELMGNRKDEVSCNEAAREAIDYTLGHFQRLDVNMETELSDAIQILTNRLYLVRTLRELLHNAARFSDGKHVSLRVTQTDITVRYTIQDVGPGLPEEADELLYKPFVKIDDLSEGLGLGLPLCKRHALSLGGDLIYDSSYREGCRFILELPK
jgi:signal transduction histidine kinase